MIRRIIKINEEKCNGCGLCAKACHEGAIEVIRGKARLIRDDYCDGLGDCLPKCPTGAISFEEREAAAYDEAAVSAAKQERQDNTDTDQIAAACPTAKASFVTSAASQLRQWPCQIKLAPVNAPYFSSADLLIAADCTAYAYAGIHENYMKDKVTLIGCPKLDSVDYSEKLMDILKNNDIKNITVLRMEVPCCGGLEAAVKKAVAGSGKTMPCQIVTISINGKVLNTRQERDS